MEPDTIEKLVLMLTGGVLTALEDGPMTGGAKDGVRMQSLKMHTLLGSTLNPQFLDGLKH